MGHPRYTKEEIVRLGEERYKQEIHTQIDEESEKGKVLVIDIETGGYEIDADGLAAARRARAKHPDAALYAMRIGYPAYAKFGGGWGTGKPS